MTPCVRYHSEGVDSIKQNTDKQLVKYINTSIKRLVILAFSVYRSEKMASAVKS